MVTCNLQGGLGNQMFQISATIALALRNGTDYKIPRTFNDPKRKIMFHHFPPASHHEILSTYNEPHFHYQAIPYQEGLCLNGFFQSEKYFNDYRSEVINAFNIPKKTKEGVVSIHIRRTDYLGIQDYHPVMTMEYIGTALAHFVGRGLSRFMVFSDDMNWCVSNLNVMNFPMCQFEYSIGRTEIEDLSHMAACDHNIIANSSFSWWGAWMNQNPHKIVIAPQTWFGSAASHDTKDLLPEAWIKI